MTKQQEIDKLRSLMLALEKGSHYESLSCESGDLPSFETKQNHSSKQSSESVKNVPVDDEKKAYQKILKVLSYKDRSVSEIRQKLQADGFTHEAVEGAIAKAIRLGILNDQRFCIQFIENSFRAGKGRRVVERALKEKGFSENEIAKLLQESSFEQENEEKRAYEFLIKHPPRGKNLRDSAFRKLVNKGYSIAAAAAAAKKYTTSINE